MKPFYLRCQILKHSFPTSPNSCPSKVTNTIFRKKNCPSCLHEYLRFLCFDLSKLCEIRKQLEIIYPALLSISFYLYSLRNESVLKMHMHFGWGKMSVYFSRYAGLVALPFPVIFLRFFFPSLPGEEGSDSYPSKEWLFPSRVSQRSEWVTSKAGIIKVAKNFWRAITQEWGDG